jgi:serine protease AprX
MNAAARNRLRAGFTSIVGVAVVLAAVAVCASPAEAQVRPPAATSATHSYIVRAVPGQLPAVETKVAHLHGRVTSHLDLINAVVGGQLSDGAVADLRSDKRVVEVTPDSEVHLLSGGLLGGLLGGVVGGVVGVVGGVVNVLGGLLAPADAWTPTATDTSTPATDPNSLFNIEKSIGARKQWAAGYTGAGIDIALLDSGVAPVAGLSDPGKVVNGPDLTPESQNPNTRYLDTYGHGTHMAGIMAGRDAGVDPVTSAGSATPFLGVAPGARVLSVKVADAHGATDVSQVIAGIDWVVQHAHDPGFNVRVLNLSFGTDSAQSYLNDPLAYAAEVAWRKGIVVVVAAGNSGTALGRLTDPAIDPYVLAVGAADTSTSDVQVASWSSRGDGTRNPDFVVPAVHVPSLRVPGSYVDQMYGGTPAAGERFIRGSGTSQAAALTSGAVALLLQRRPSLTPDQVKASLRGGTGLLGGDTSKAQGTGLVNLTGSVNYLTTYLTGYLGMAPKPQAFPPSVGNGTLEGSRGTNHLLLNNIPLAGEMDMFGQPFNAAAMAAREAAGTSWTGGSWNGSNWTGAGWDVTGWSTPVWTGRTWAGDSWSGRTWADGYWDGRTWAATHWTGDSWTGFGWFGRTWAGAGWEGIQRP